MRTFPEMHAMAQRQLDGMTVNRDLMARDVLQLLMIITRYQEALKAERIQREAAEDALRDFGRAPPKVEGFADKFDDIFKDIFKDYKPKG